MIKHSTIGFLGFILLVVPTILPISTPKSKKCTHNHHHKKKDTSPDPEFIIVIPSYNNEAICLKNLESAINQHYTHFEIIYINDCSTDNTGTLINNYVAQSPLRNRVTVIHNPVRQGGMKNLYEIIHGCPNNKIIVLLDGDDLLYPYALSRLARVFENKKIWFSYGGDCLINNTTKLRTTCKPYPYDVIKSNKFRSIGFRITHPIVFYAGLFKLIHQEDLMYEGKYIPTSHDNAYSYPMIEMASKGHFVWLPNILYVYNNQSPLNDARIRLQEQKFFGRYIKALPPYEPLDKPIFLYDTVE
jgi:glycosyltransferase involved in cell wall biosynthesis